MASDASNLPVNLDAIVSRLTAASVRGVIELRAWRVEDADAINAAVAESRAHLVPWMPWAAEPPMTAAARRAWIRDRLREAEGGGDRMFGIWSGGVITGSCGLHRRIGPGGLEIGYWTHVAFVRRGIASAAVARCCALAFSEPSITRVEIHHDAANVISGRVAERAGFTHVCDQPEPPTGKAGTGVERVWRLTRADWEARHGTSNERPSPAIR